MNYYLIKLLLANVYSHFANRFPRTFATSLKYLVQTEIYPLDLIKKAMDHDYLKAVYKNNAYRIGREYLEINSSIQIDVPEYQGPFLPPKILSYLTKVTHFFYLQILQILSLYFVTIK